MSLFLVCFASKTIKNSSRTSLMTLILSLSNFMRLGENRLDFGDENFWAMADQLAPQKENLINKILIISEWRSFTWIFFDWKPLFSCLFFKFFFLIQLFFNFPHYSCYKNYFWPNRQLLQLVSIKTRKIRNQRDLNHVTSGSTGRCSSTKLWFLNLWFFPNFL